MRQSIQLLLIKHFKVDFKEVSCGWVSILTYLVIHCSKIKTWLKEKAELYFTDTHNSSIYYSSARICLSVPLIVGSCEHFISIKHTQTLLHKNRQIIRGSWHTSGLENPGVSPSIRVGQAALNAGL